jgi:predicted enzyme related to lactoylglutathione lyase
MSILNDENLSMNQTAGMGTLGELMEVILYVQDMAGQVAFYRDRLGLRVKQPRDLADYSGEFWVELDTGACTLVLHGGGRRRLAEDTPKIVFRVADIHAAREELAGREVALGPARSPAPGVWVCDGKDPEGNPFSIEQHA